jgi:hypothetical protein
MALEGNRRGLVEALSRNLPRGAAENHEKLQSGYQVSRPTFEWRTSWMQLECVIARRTCSVRQRV